MEAIGLALGVAPLIVELLKSHPQPVHALAALSHENTKLSMLDFYTDLQCEVALLKLTLNSLLEDLPLPQELQENLANEWTSDSTIWNDPPAGLEDALHSRLEPCTQSFKHTMEVILSYFAKIIVNKDVLPFLNSDQIQRCTETPYRKLEVLVNLQLDVRKRLRLGWKKKDLQTIVTGITKCNKKLDKMLKRTRAKRTRQTPIEAKPTSEHMPHLKLLGKMNRLRCALEQACCACETDKHEIRLGLAGLERLDDYIKTEMIMNTSADQSKWYWAGSSVHVHLESPQSPETIGMPASPLEIKQRSRSSSSLSGTTIAGSPGSDAKSGVENEEPSKIPADKVTVHNENQDDIQCSDCSEKISQLNEIVPLNNVSLILKRGQSVRKAPQLVFCQDKLWHKGPTANLEIAKSEPGLSLDHYLHSGNMTLKDRKITQVRLAQSVLHIPWTGQDLNKGSIMFHSTHDKPFATLTLNKPNESTVQWSKSKQVDCSASEYKPYNNETLAALAIMLLEMELATPIEALRNQKDTEGEDDDPSDFVKKFWTLERVLKEQEFNMYMRIHGVIDACIKCDFGQQPSNLEDPQVLQIFYNQVVAPLEEELWSAFALRIPYLEDLSLKYSSDSIATSPEKTGQAYQQKLNIRKSVKILEPRALDR